MSDLGTHALRPLIANADDLGGGMVMHHAEKIPHVHVIKVNPGYFPWSFHDAPDAAGRETSFILK